jgi:SSS family solute:Na+ symporter
MWPHGFAAVYSARSPRTIRRNAMFLPFYQIMLLFTFYVGFVALLVVPGLTGDATNGTLLTLTSKALPEWVLGLVGGAGALAAMVPASLLLLSAATLLSRNIWQGVIRPQTSEDTVLAISRVMVVVITGVALYFAIASPSLLVNLLLTGYDGVTQFFPAIVASLLWRRVTTPAAFAGILTGVIVAMWLVLGNHDPLAGMNAGFVALVANTVVLVVVSLATGRARAIEPFASERLIPGRAGVARG